MSTKIRYCLLCHRRDRRTSRRGFIRISTVEREEKLREGYRRRSNGEEINQTVLNEVVHRRCYNKIIQAIPSIDQSHSTDHLVTNANEQNQDGEHDQVRDDILSLEKTDINLELTTDKRRRRVLIPFRHRRDLDLINIITTVIDTVHHCMTSLQTSAEN